MVAILDNTGNPVAEYTYDAWGSLLNTNSSVEGHVVEYNPLRYRGYVYDTETELYYLQSRYYDPEIGRFINADVYVSTGQGALGNNMFAYCLNNPINNCDSTGCLTDGQIHDAVLEEISKRSGYRYKYKRQDTMIIYRVAFGAKWFGFCDLYDPLTGEVWELKKNTSSPSCQTYSAINQLTRYCEGYLFTKPKLKLKKPENSIPPGFFSIIDNLGTKYIVNYWDQGEGILRYQYYMVPSNYSVAYAVVVAGAFAASIRIQPDENQFSYDYQY